MPFGVIYNTELTEPQLYAGRINCTIKVKVLLEPQAHTVAQMSDSSAPSQCCRP